MIKFDRDEVAYFIDEWVKENLSESFIFRPFQKEAILSLIENILTGKKVQVIEAPTGSGKSYIAIIAAGVLYQHFRKTSYILVSDVTLFRQYEKDLNKFNLRWGCICGKDNYLCSQNGECFSNSKCQINNISVQKLSDPITAKEEGYFCATSCKYIKEHKRAMAAPITVMTYQLWFISMCLMKDTDGVAFPKKDIVICDEAHKLADIVQSQFSPRISMGEMEYLSVIDNFMETHGDEFDNPSVNPGFQKFNQTYEIMKLVYNKNYSDINEKRRDLKMLFDRFYDLFNKLSGLYEELTDIVKEAPHPQPYYKVLKAFRAMINDYCRMELYKRVIEQKGISNFIPSLTNDEVIEFNCACEAELIKETFHKEASQEILMSATIGDADIYMGLIGATDFSKYAMEVPSIFDFSKSPIYFSSKYKMSYTEKANSLPHILEVIKEILNKHKSERGIIHSGTYEISKAIYDSLPPDLKTRIIFYNNAKGRSEAIALYKKFTNKILMGPSILEGLDFEGDLCRFIIIAKLPYASLSNNLVQAKMELYPNWYQYDCVNKITQGIGRGVRSETDYCSTYIVDGCFSDLVRRSGNLFSKNISSRFRRL